MKTVLFLALGLLGVFGCSRHPLPASALDDIREATYRYQFTKNASGLQQKAQVYFLAVTEAGKSTDPSAKLIARFSGNSIRVAPWSDSISTAAAGVRDKNTGEQGLIFRCGAIRLLSDETAEVDGGYYEGTESSSWNTYTLKKTPAGWTVEHDVMHRISLAPPRSILATLARLPTGTAYPLHAHTSGHANQIHARTFASFVSSRDIGSGKCLAKEA